MAPLTFLILLAVVVYFTFCILVAYASRKTEAGFLGTFILSLLFTPLLVAIFVVLFTPKRKAKS